MHPNTPKPRARYPGIGVNRDWMRDRPGRELTSEAAHLSGHRVGTPRSIRGRGVAVVQGGDQRGIQNMTDNETEVDSDETLQHDHEWRVVGTTKPDLGLMRFVEVCELEDCAAWRRRIPETKNEVDRSEPNVNLGARGVELDNSSGSVITENVIGGDRDE